jgi:hypothetical protein
MNNPFKSLFGSVMNKVNVVGINNKTINIISSDGVAVGFAPQIGWNPSPQAGPGQAVWLEWRSQLTTLIGREAEQKLLTDWANEPHAVSFKIIEAHGGVGKTRLAAEVTQHLLSSGHWSGGFASVVDFERAQRLAWQGNWFIVVDYPEHSPERLAKLVRAAKEGAAGAGKNKLRILLLCRASQSIRHLLQQQGVQGYTSDLLQLPELASADSLHLLNQSLHKLAPSLSNIDKVDFDAWRMQSPLHHTALFVVALALHLSTAPALPNRFLQGAVLLKELLAREQARWEKAEDGQGLTRGTLADVVAFGTLFNGLPMHAVNTSLSAAYQWQNTASSLLTKVHNALGEVWPLDASSQTYPAMAPDLLAAVMLWQWQSQPTKCGLTTDAKLLGRLVHALPQTSMNERLQRWHMQSYDQTVRLELGLPKDAPSLANLLQNAADADSGFLVALKSSFSTQSSWAGLSALAVSVSKPRTEVDASLAELTQARRAQELHNHAVDLASAGDRSAALEAAKEAVAIRRRLAKTNPAAYEPVLAGSINNLANFLSETGDRPAALEAAKEAVAMCRRLAKTNPAAYEPDLGKSINNLGGFLSETGDHPAALEAAKEAVAMCRRLAKTNPAAYEPDLATSINNLAIFLSETGDRRAALEAAKEAVALYEKANRETPAAFEREFQNAKNTLEDLLANPPAPKFDS